MSARAGKRVLRRDERAAEAASMREQGLSLREIAARQGVSHETVRGDLKRHDSMSLADAYALTFPGRDDLGEETG